MQQNYSKYVKQKRNKAGLENLHKSVIKNWLKMQHNVNFLYLKNYIVD